MAWVAVAVGAFNAANQIQAGRGAAAQAGLQAMQSDYQAGIEEASALKTAGNIRKAGRYQAGAANAAFAASGVQVGQGSAAEVEFEINKGVEQDAFQTILDGSRRASGLRTDATMTRIDGSMRKSAGVVAAVGTMLGTGAKAYSKWNTTPSAGDGLSQGDRRKLGVN